jgi:N-acetylated-alpha-linked acidic dipeptidase
MINELNVNIKEYAYRNKSLESSFLPNIPAQVISYKYAYDLFKLIEPNKNQVKSDWRGDFNLTYTYGGKLANNRKLRLNVFNKRKIEKTYNVIGVIEGSIEPDRYIILGNHRDSWSFGSIDPSSGTSVMMEVSRVLASLKNNKIWTPKRSIMFISWGAEEYGLIGSYEWVDVIMIFLYYSQLEFVILI